MFKDLLHPMSATPETTRGTFPAEYVGDGRESIVVSAPMSDRTASIPVIDTFGVANDSKMPFLAKALNPVEVQRRFDGELRAIRAVRYKPQRRCLIEYDVDDITLVGKVRAKGLDEPTYRLQEVLWKNGFGSQNKDGISVPEPIKMVPEFQMWLQR